MLRTPLHVTPIYHIMFEHRFRITDRSESIHQALQGLRDSIRRLVMDFPALVEHYVVFDEGQDHCILHNTKETPKKWDRDKLILRRQEIRERCQALYTTYGGRPRVVIAMPDCHFTLSLDDQNKRDADWQVKSNTGLTRLGTLPSLITGQTLASRNLLDPRAFTWSSPTESTPSLVGVLPASLTRDLVTPLRNLEGGSVGHCRPHVIPCSSDDSGATEPVVNTVEQFSMPITCNQSLGMGSPPQLDKIPKVHPSDCDDLGMSRDEIDSKYEHHEQQLQDELVLFLNYADSDTSI